MYIIFLYTIYKHIILIIPFSLYICQNYDRGLLTESQPYQSYEQWERQVSHNQDYNILIRCDLNPTMERNNILIYRKSILYRIYASQCHLYTILHLLQGQFSNANNYIISLKSTLLNYDKSQVASEKAHSSFLPYDQHISAGDAVFETLVDSSILAVYEVYVHIISSIRPTSDSSSSSSSSGDDKHNSGIQASEEVDIYTRIDSILTSIHDIRLHLIDPDCGSDSGDGPKPEKGAMILSPKWVRKVSYFTRIFASIVPLLIQSLYYNIIQPASPSLLEGPIAQASTSGSSSGGGRKASPGLSSSGSDATTVTSSSSVTTANLDGSGSSSAVGVQKQSSSSSSTSVGASVVYVSLDGVDKHSEGYTSACEAVKRLKEALMELLGMLHVYYAYIDHLS